MEYPRITVITPSLNQAAFLEKTLLSVLNQNYENLEYFVVDGGSTDGSKELIQSYSSRITWWVSERDRGQSHAINKGLQRATGELIAYLNSDDLYLPGALREIAEAHRADPRADLLHGRCRIINEVGEKIGERFGRIGNYLEILDLWDIWWKERNFVQPEVFWTKRISDEIGSFREDLNWVMDYDYWARIFRAGGKICRIDSALACFRRQPKQKSTVPEKTAEELLSVVRPLIWEKGLPRSNQLALKGKWLFDARFRKEAAHCVQNSIPRWRRWIRLNALLLRYPEMLFAAQFRKRAFRALGFSSYQPSRP